MQSEPVPNGLEPTFFAREPAPREKVAALCVDCDTFDAVALAEVAARSKQLDIDLVVCRTEAEAQAMLHERRFDVIFVEYWLGEETSVRFIHGCGVRRDAPCVVVTALDEPDIRRVAFRAGAQGFLAKSALSPQALESVTLAVLRSAWDAAQVA